MRRKPLARKLFPIFLAISVFCVLVVGLSAILLFKRYEQANAQQELVARARLIAHVIKITGAMADVRALQHTITKLAALSGARITIVSPSGVVLADSEANPSTMENHSDRPEIRMALSGKIGVFCHKSPTIGRAMYYAAMPFFSDGQIRAAIRVARTVKAVDAPATAIALEVGAVLGGITLLAAVLSMVAARKISRPLSDLQNAALALAQRDLRYRATAFDIAELASLAESLNSMSSRIEEQIRDIEKKSAIQEAILASMNDAVLVIGDDDKIIIANEACRRLLGIDPGATIGRRLQEAIRRPALHRFVEMVRTEAQPSKEEQILDTEGGLTLRMSGAVLVDSTGRKVGGILIVLTDVTEARKLDRMRRDFVANVSHELKTPITAIKGYLETLLDFEKMPRDRARDFLETALRQTDRLNAIIDDLLKLAEIEQKAEASAIDLQVTPIRPVIELSVANLESLAADKQMAIDIQCPEDLVAPINAPLFERAITNLIDNAVKYCPEKSHISVVAERTDSEVAIRVTDNGPGIAPEHLPRIFERFYRVDPARSRKLGGTGLGLAIVKHVAQAHQGRVEVQSKVGQGSTFTIYIPAAQNSSQQATAYSTAKNSPTAH